MPIVDRLRQILAGLASGLLFMGLLYGLGVIWWAAFIIAMVTYFGMVVLLPRSVPAQEIVLSGSTTRADLHQAGQIIDFAAEKLRSIQPRLPDTERDTVEEMITYLQAIRRYVARDADSYRRTRKLTKTYITTMVETVERFADFADKSDGQHLDRLEPLTTRIEGYATALRKAEKALLLKDVRALETHMEALDGFMRLR